MITYTFGGLEQDPFTYRIKRSSNAHKCNIFINLIHNRLPSSEGIYTSREPLLYQFIAASRITQPNSNTSLNQIILILCVK